MSKENAAMKNDTGLSYAEAGVDISVADATKVEMKKTLNQSNFI